MKKVVVPIILGFVLSNAVSAVEYQQVLAGKSTIGFVYKQMNVPMEGNFPRFSGQISFDPAKPANSSARFDIDVASIDTGALDADAEVRGKLWFNTKDFPQAQFVSTSIKPAGTNRFDVSGKLTIKGKTKDVTTPVSFRMDGSNAVFDGTFVIRRADFSIGEGIWADYGTVANEVQIKFHLMTTAAPNKK